MASKFAITHRSLKRGVFVNYYTISMTYVFPPVYPYSHSRSPHFPSPFIHFSTTFLFLLFHHPCSLSNLLPSFSLFKVFISSLPILISSTLPLFSVPSPPLPPLPPPLSLSLPQSLTLTQEPHDIISASFSIKHY